MFRWRSYIPLVLVVLFVYSFKYYDYPADAKVPEHVWEGFCLFIALLGLGIRSYAVGYAAKGTSGRNTTKQKAAVLNTSGLYSVVRNPLYVGNYISWLGLSMFMMMWWVSLLVTLIFWIYYERIILAEELFLREVFGSEFLEWAERTPVFIPKFSNWTPPTTKFDIRTVLKREQSGLLAIVASFTFLEVAGDFIKMGRIVIEPMWAVIFFSGLTIFLVLTGLKKTKLI